MRKNKSFTIIELLVVIIIIGILSAISFSVASSARLKARDATRKKDLQTYRAATVMYKSVEREYPQITAAACAPLAYQINWLSLVQKLAPYLPRPPYDPQINTKNIDALSRCLGAVTWPIDAPTGVHSYLYVADDTTANPGVTNKYTYIAALESKTDRDRNASTAPNNGTGSKYDYYYWINPRITKTQIPFTNAQQLYAVGCVLIDKNDPYETDCTD